MVHDVITFKSGSFKVVAMLWKKIAWIFFFVIFGDVFFCDLNNLFSQNICFLKNKWKNFWNVDFMMTSKEKILEKEF